MKNIAINALSYTGIVTLSQQIGNNKVKIAQIHNTGGASLFSFLATCLIGNFDLATVSYPAKIKLLNWEQTEDSYDYTSASGFIFLRTPAQIITETTGECKVRYSFMIPRDLLENVPSIKNLGLGLYARSTKENDPENFAAFCRVDLNGTQIATNSSLLVDWDLIITNNSDTVNANSTSAIAVKMDSK